MKANDWKECGTIIVTTSALKFEMQRAKLNSQIREPILLNKFILENT
jgi:hypothetical protein